MKRASRLIDDVTGETAEAASTNRPLKVMFVITSMPVGGAEVLLANLVETFDRSRIIPRVCCLKEPGELGESIRGNVPLFHGLIGHRYDFAVIQRLRSLFREQQIDAVVTVGAGDKMFWGRLAARYAGVPVIFSALHSTGWPDELGRLNRWLTGITDGFIAVAESHRQYLIQNEQLPAEKVFLVPNGVDIQHFKFDQEARQRWRAKLGIAINDPVCGIVAALRPEKNHRMFLRLAEKCGRKLPRAHFLVVGDGPERATLERSASRSEVAGRLHFLGTSDQVAALLSTMDLFALTSLNEASPVSILEAMACRRPVVAPEVGSIPQAVIDGETGYLFPVEDTATALKRWLQILCNPDLAARLGYQGRARVEAYGSLQTMTDGYTALLERVYAAKTPLGPRGRDWRRPGVGAATSPARP